MFNPLQPLELDDFSGGITDNYLQGDPRRSQKIDNFLISPDKKLKMRPGIVPLDTTNYVLPASSQAGQRINGMYFFMSEKQLFVQGGRKFFALDPGTSTLVETSGYNSVDALSGGDVSSQTTSAEFQRQVFLTSDGIDGLGVMPSKIYQDSSNTWRAKTAGLPKAYVSGTYTDAQLLAKCIVNANAIKASMISHMQDSEYTIAVNGFQAVGTQTTKVNLHINQDKYSLSYLTTETFNPGVIGVGNFGDPEAPSPVPTAAADATTQATLFTLVAALNNAYSHHVAEASSASLNPIGGALSSTNYYYVTGIPGSIVPNANGLYHMRLKVSASTSATATSSLQKPQGGPHAVLTSNATPTTLIQAATMLDDLLQKWNWHRKAVWCHSPTNDPQQFDKYIPQCTAVGTITQGNSTPVVTPDYTDIINYANNLKQVYSVHTNYGPNNSVLINFPPFYFTGHTMGNHPIYNLDLTCRLPDATDLNSAYLLIYWVRALYYLHYMDANVPSAFVGVTYTSADGTPTISAVTKTVDASAVSALPVSYFTITDNNVDGAAMQAYAGQLVTDMAYAPNGNLTLDRNINGTVSGKLAQYGSSVYHVSTDSAGNFLDSASGNLEQAADALATPASSVGTDTASWLVLASDVFYALTSHMAYKKVHLPAFSNTAATAVATALSSCVNPFFIPSVSQVSYAFFFSDAYTVGVNGIQYLVRGNPVVSASTQVAVTWPTNYTIPSATPTVYPSIINTFTRANVLSGLPVLSNAGNTNYDTSNALLNICRTTNGGQTYYLLAQVANGTSSYSDTTNDTVAASVGVPALQSNQTMYTTGGTVGSDQPPQSKFVHIFAGTTYYGGITDSGQYFPQQVRQSVQFAPDWVPATFADNLDDDITGLSSTKSNVIALCKNSVYRMSGGFSQTGQGALTHDRIADSVGSLNAKGIVKTEIGVFFPGNDGFYYTDGYQVIKLSLELNKTYQNLTASDVQKRAIHGAYDKATRRIWWSMRASGNDHENSIVYVFYLDYGIKPSGTFTTVSNPGNFWPASLVFNQGVLYMGDGSGYILKSDDSNKYDFQTSGFSTYGLAAKTYIPWCWISSAIDMGTIAKRKYVTKMHLVGINSGNMAIQPYMLKDLNNSGIGPLPLTPILYKANNPWGQPSCVWGDSTQKWKLDGKLDVWRRFPRYSLRSDFMQLQLSPSYQAVYSSSADYPVGCNAVVDATLKTATIKTPSGYTAIQWYPDIINSYIYFQTDGYVQGFLISTLTVSNTVITYIDASNLSVTNASGVPWVIRGYRINQSPTITSISLTFAQVGDKVQAYPGASSSAGTGNGGENPS